MQSSICVALVLQLAIAVTLSYSASTSGSQKQTSSRIKRAFEDISGDGRYEVQWQVDFDTNIITFDVKAKTLGFVGFGISPQGGMTGADIFVGGVNPDGTLYSSDRYGTGPVEPILDDKQDWTLISASEVGEYTNLRFSRLLDTCDKAQDVAITPDTIKIIWSFGSTDVLAWHGANRGSAQVNLLDPPMPPVDTSKFDKWRIEASLEMPAAQTTYWCTIHKSPPNYMEQRHVIGFETKLETPDALAHTHHFTVFKCKPPPGETHAWFEQFLTESDDCYAQRPRVPVEYCRDTLYIWAVGGKPLFLPEDIGYRILEDTTVEYVMLDIHYNNPTNLVGVQVPTAVELYNTKDLRPVDANILNVLHQITYQNLVPPGVENFLQVAHCAPQCTEGGLKPEGVKLVNIMFHAHLLGRKMKLRHFRGKTELPWINVDDSYDFDFQQSRPLREEISLLPGDQLTVECTYNSMDRTGVTIGGYQSQEEMCQAIIWYYPRSNGGLGCQSGYNETKLMQRFGIEAISQETVMHPPIVTAPAQLAGKTLMAVVDGLDNYWTPERLEEFQKEIISEHVDKSCGNTIIKYPVVVDEEWAPVDTCELAVTGPTAAPPTNAPVTNAPATGAPPTNAPITNPPATTPNSATNLMISKTGLLFVLSVLVVIRALYS